MTLTEAAHWTKRFGVLIGIGVALFFFGVFVYLSIEGNRDYTDFIKPDYACTDTASEFVENRLSIPSIDVASGSDMVYELETETGKVDSLPRVVNVHKFNIAGQSLNAQGESKIIASKLGFNPERIQRKGSSEYYFTDPLTYRSLTVYARNLNFKLETDFTKPGSFNYSGTLPSEKDAISTATSYLRSLGLLFQDYFETTPEVVNINIQPNGSFTQANSRSDAELIRVDFYREKPFISLRADMDQAVKIKEALEKRDMVSETTSILTDKGRVDMYDFNTIVAFEDPNRPNISVYIGPENPLLEKTGGSSAYVYKVDFIYWPVDSEACGTYPLIAPQTALEQVQKGTGSLVYLNEKNGDDVVAYTAKKVSKFTIYTITIGYFEPKAESEFMQPVYIISGEATLSSGVIGKFHYYVPAIDYANLKNKAN